MENKLRCAWCEKDDLYRKYHDEDWGIPIYDDATIFEFLILETFQAGLSWYTILKKRENFRSAFDNFDYIKIAQYQEDKIQVLLKDPGIIRNKLKVHSAVTNAQAFIKIQEEFGSFSNYIWNFTNQNPIINHPKTLKDVAATTPLSDTISKDLKKRGFKFVGSTVIYAFLQATGIVNDHLQDCWISKQ
ncbi:DNA-3-methyladenine glycosylase I [Flavobacterium sp. P4023]|uniref:DNA-3-methyladenine glycosylase I n=1 Tax=Flavobacterium flabelliforme TaxID=2816119 RepID=A0ABS5CQC8_9FLAO|nr:DNA-3-methyladenine glycosylase I [Flavobacterium flabelliforme]MBP4140794.1 DNA-3-methyladenine glycosylase I [Flavobacterium flabelliforme]